MAGKQSRTMEVAIVAKDKTKAGTKSAEGNFDKVASAAKGAAIAAAAAGVAIGTAVVAKSLKLWAIQEQAIIQVEKRLKSTGASAWTTSKQMQAMAASLQKTTTFGDETILQMESLLLTFKKINSPEILERTTRSVLDMASALAQSTGGEPDLRSAATMVGKALQDPVLGLTAMSRAGIQFTDEQKDVIKNLVETNRQAEAQIIILQELESQFGGASGAEGLSGAAKQAQNNFGDLFEEFGEGLTVTNELEGSLRGLTDYMGDQGTKDNVKGFGEDMAAIGGGLLEIEKIAWNIARNNPFTAIFKASGALLDAQKEGLKAILGGPGAVPTLGGIGGANAAGADVGAFQDGPGFSALSIGGLSGIGNVAGAGVEGAESPRAKALRAEHDLFLTNIASEAESFLVSLLSEEEQLDITYENRQNKLEEFQANNLISVFALAEAERRIGEDKERHLTKLSKDQAKIRQQNAMNSLRGIGQFADNIFGAMANSAEEGSRKEFKANQNRAIGSAVVNTAQGATKAFSQWGWPWGAAAAGAVLLAGGKQISRIKSQEYGGGGSVEGDAPASFSTPTFQDNAVPQPVTQPESTTNQGGPTYNVTVLGTVVGDLDTFARSIITPIEQARLDGVEARVV